jgi:hypothetical protein
MAKTRTSRSTKSTKSSKATKTVAAVATSHDPIVASSARPAPQPSPIVMETEYVLDSAPGEMAQEAPRPVSHDEIARRAFEIYLRRGGTHGNAVQDWLAAERELGLRAA